MHRTKLGAILAATAALAAAGAIAAAPSAFATGGGGDCVTITRTDLADVTLVGGGTATLTEHGLLISTPEQPSKVTYRHTLPAPVDLDDVRGLSYVTTRMPASTGVPGTVAAYKIGVDADGDGDVDGTLVYEPLYNVTVGADAQTHKPLDGTIAGGPAGTTGAGKWWYSAEPGNAQTLAAWSTWAAGTGPVTFAKPRAVWFGVEQGTSNTGAITLAQSLTFKTRGYCKVIKWDAEKTPATTPPATPPATTPAGTPPATLPATTPAAGTGGGNDDELALTGSPVFWIAGVGGLMLAVGAIALAVTYRRRVRVIAP